MEQIVLVFGVWVWVFGSILVCLFVYALQGLTAPRRDRIRYKLPKIERVKIRRSSGFWTSPENAD